MAEVSYVRASDEQKVVPITESRKSSVSRRSSANSTGTGLATANLKNKFKVVVLGDVMVGKTSFIARFLYGNFNSSYQATIGIDFLSTTVSLPERTVRLQLWDTAGQERFRSLIPSYIRDCAVAFVLYDVTERTSFEHVKDWVTRVKTEGGDRVIIALCANKIDLNDKRVVSVEEGEALAKEIGAIFYETSAKTGDNVKTAFHKAAAELPNDETLLPETLQTNGAVILKPTVTPLPKDAQGSCLC